MLFSAILRRYDSESSLNLNCLTLYTVREEITRATINKMRMADQLSHLVKAKESLGDVCGDSYRVGSQVEPNVNPNSLFTNFVEKRKKVVSEVDASTPMSGFGPTQTMPPYKVMIKRPVSPSKRKRSILSSAPSQTISQPPPQPQPQTIPPPPPSDET